MSQKAWGAPFAARSGKREEQLPGRRLQEIPSSSRTLLLAHAKPSPGPPSVLKAPDQRLQAVILQSLCTLTQSAPPPGCRAGQERLTARVEPERPFGTLYPPSSCCLHSVSEAWGACACVRALQFPRSSLRAGSVSLPSLGSPLCPGTGPQSAIHPGRLTLKGSPY